MKRFDSVKQAVQEAKATGATIGRIRRAGKWVDAARFRSGETIPLDELTPDVVEAQHAHAGDGPSLEVELDQLDWQERKRAELALQERCVEIREAVDRVKIKVRRLNLQIERPNSLLQREGLYRAAQELNAASAELMALTAPEDVKRILTKRKAS